MSDDGWPAPENALEPPAAAALSATPERLLVEPVPPEYEKFAELYRRATSKRQRSAIAMDLRRACEKTAGERGPVRIEIDLTPVDL